MEIPQIVRGRVEWLPLIVLPHHILMPSTGPVKLRRLAFVIVLGVSIASIAACTKSSDTGPTPVVSAPNTIHRPLNIDSDLGWALSNGERAKFADYRGKVLVLDFYATWCAPCRESIPRLIALQRQYGPTGLEIVGLNVGGADDRIKVVDFAKEMGIQYPLGFPDKSLTDRFLFDDQTIPQTFVFGRQGQLRSRFRGYKESFGKELEKAIQFQIAER